MDQNKGLLPVLFVCFFFLLTLLGLIVTACTRAIWIGRNNKIIQEFTSYMSEMSDQQDNQDEEPGDEWGGIWVGNE